MNLIPRHKLIAALCLTLVVPLLAAAQGASPALSARILLGAIALGGLVFWFFRARAKDSATFKSSPRLNVVQRVGLSQRTGLALIEVDGKSYLVVHGDGFARIRPASPRATLVRQPLRSVHGVAS